MTLAARVSYRSYLHLDKLLDTPQPLTPVEDTPIWLAERFFIVCHQTTELWLSQVLLDLEHAAQLSERADWRGTVAVTARATSTVLLLVRDLAELFHLSREHFLRFRSALEGSSGADSKHGLEMIRGGRHVHVRAIRAAVAAANPHAGSACPADCGHEVCAVAATVDSLLEGIRLWRTLHVEIAEHFVGGLPGTGGTTGVKYLQDGLVTER